MTEIDPCATELSRDLFPLVSDKAATITLHSWQDFQVEMAQQEQRRGEIGRNQVVLGRPVVLPKVYEGNSSWMDWAEHFETVAVVNGWQDEEKLLWLRVRLVRRAATAFKRVLVGARASYGQCSRSGLIRAVSRSCTWR